MTIRDFTTRVHLLRGWKAIGDFLECDVRTAQSYQAIGLPVCRKQGTVMSTDLALAAWALSDWDPDQPAISQN